MQTLKRVALSRLREAKEPVIDHNVRQRIRGLLEVTRSVGSQPVKQFNTEFATFLLICHNQATFPYNSGPLGSAFRCCGERYSIAMLLYHHPFDLIEGHLGPICTLCRLRMLATKTSRKRTPARIASGGRRAQAKTAL